MKKSMQIMVLLTMVLALTVGCASNASTQPSINPQVSTTPAQSTAKPEEQAKVFTLAGKAADIVVNSKKIPGNAYYMDTDGKNILLPFTEVCKGLGWAVTEPGAAGPIEIKMTKQGAEEIVISYIKPAHDMFASVGDVKITKAGKLITINEMEDIPYLEGMLYTTEEFISQAVEKIAVTFNGETIITVTPSA